MDLTARYDTAKVAALDRFAYWRDVICESYVQLGCDTKNVNDFNGSLEIHRHSVLSVSHVSGMAHTAERRKRDIRSATDEYFLLSLQTAKTSRITQFGKTSVLNPGDMALYASSDPYKLELSDDFSKTVVQLPKDKLIARLPNAHALVAHKIDGQSGIGKLVSENIIEFSKHANENNPALREMVQATLIDLIATGLASEIGQRVELSSPEQHVMMRAKSFIRGNLGNPDLDRTMVADDIGMSVRRLNAIFAKEDNSIAEYIRAERLKRVALELRDQRYASLSISEIAMRNGFSNLQHFSTLFRSTQGITPKGYRQT
ncbi:MAG: helix-turn-helix domain-containing protein [Cognatishimia sp.]|uniref:AraC-like ligand-binding domain-containing protein n=1 Tax=Cognatishimia sp. 1_MG-2023 TaxID=3062642 RepID=UPI0026E182CE|nr:helix-turn-helix domain-containing protein [Cognatishimia sp. 1_MG-2023]MDO6727968.1 helix-turn-helix domain-containing protein [Cognatishimia sp. 1_MG-2023]